MVRIKLNGIPVDIPYNPYPPQLITMSKLIESFQNNTHSLIESPTGTGKSLSPSSVVYLLFTNRRGRILMIRINHSRYSYVVGLINR